MNKIPSNTFLEKLKNEQYRRDIEYKKLNYLVSNFGIFDFISSELYTMLLVTKKFANYFELEEITNDLLLFVFLFVEKSTTNLLSDFNLSYKSYINKFLKIKKNKFLQTEQKIKNNNIMFSNETNILFLKASQNAFKKFQTLTITPSILFLTFLELNNFKFFEIKNLYKLRYLLIKKIYKEEIFFHSNTFKNQYYFFSILRGYLNEKNLKFITQNNATQNILYRFRNRLIKNILNNNIIKTLKKELINSIYYKSKRQYNIYIGEAFRY